jgi:CRP/FNR family transcriptional regulator, putaive post-exponential-phase nitrogen-starvation regulator
MIAVLIGHMSYRRRGGVGMDSIRGYVRRFSLEALLSADLIGALRLLSKEPGELLIGSGQAVREILFFVEGRAKSYSTMDNGQSVLAAFARPLEVFGEAELFSADRYTLSIKAIAPSVCLALPVATIKKAADRNCRLFMYLCGRLGAKLSDRVIAESINLRYPVEIRLASFLLAAMDEGGEVLGTDDLGELSDFIGASYRQLARVVRRFRDEGILDGARGRIRVVDAAKLRPLASDLYTRRSGLQPKDFSR